MSGRGAEHRFPYPTVEKLRQRRRCARSRDVGTTNNMGGHCEQVENRVVARARLRTLRRVRETVLSGQ